MQVAQSTTAIFSKREVLEALRFAFGDNVLMLKATTDPNKIQLEMDKGGAVTVTMSRPLESMERCIAVRAE
jgi:hypothetical protein